MNKRMTEVPRDFKTSRGLPIVAQVRARSVTLTILSRSGTSSGVLENAAWNPAGINTAMTLMTKRDELVCTPLCDATSPSSESTPVVKGRRRRYICWNPTSL
jgi:hypothetical protein